MIKALEEKIISKITKEGYEIIYWIFSFLALVFLTRLVINFLSSTINTGYFIIESIIDEKSFKEIFFIYLLDYIVGIVLSLIAFIFVLKVEKWSRKKTDIKIEKKKLFFITGIYLIIIYTINLFSYGVYMIVISIQGSTDIFGISFSTPLIYIIINLLSFCLYIIVGIILIRKSQYLASDLHEV